MRTRPRPVRDAWCSPSGQVLVATCEGLAADCNRDDATRAREDDVPELVDDVVDVD